MRIPARQLARTSKRGRVLHIVEWRHTDLDKILSLCNDGLVLMAEDNGDLPHLLPLCKLCLKAEEAIRALITFSDLKVNRIDISALTIAQVIVAALQYQVPHHAVIAAENGCSCSGENRAVLEWYTPVGGDEP